MSRSLLALSVALAIFCLLLSGAAHAGAVRRYAVIIGNDQGEAGETPLRYAESDSVRVADVLGRVGGVSAENIVLLRGSDADTALRALIAMNDRIRTSGADGDTMLLVYYSGHGDRRSLHLGQSRLDLTALEQLVRGSAATLRLLIVDACHSGALTLVKGGRSAPRLDIDLGARLSGEGIVFLTSSSASEEAQESDELGGSFFTHYLVSGLLGAADQNQDGLVALKEVYRHAYENTIRASSRTEAGVQHPTFRDELGGQGAIALAQLSLGPRSSSVRLPSGASFLLFQQDSAGPVVLELGVADTARVLHVKPGRYYLRGRGPDSLFEGAVDVPAGARVDVTLDALDRVDFARMVRRGGRSRQRASGPLVGYQARTPIARGASLCQGPVAGYSSASTQLSWSGRVSACRGELEGELLRATTDELSVEGRVARVWDGSLASAEAGGGVGLALLHQSFESEAPARNTLAPYATASGALVRYLPHGWRLAAELSGLAYVLPVEAAPQDDEAVVRFAARVGLQLGVEFMSH